jgi:hypothetical protein
MNNLETLINALDYRNDEVNSYQININNYARAIAKIDADYADDPDLSGPFKGDLTQRLEAEIIQQRRAIVIRDVIAEQIAELEANP